MATGKEGENRNSDYKKLMEKYSEIEDITKRHEDKIKILEEELISIRKKVYPLDELAQDVKDYVDPKYNALSVRMGNVETIVSNMDTKMANMDTKMTNMDTKMTNMDTKMTNVDSRMDTVEKKIDRMDERFDHQDSRLTKIEETLVKGINDIKKGQSKIAKEPADSLYK